MVVAFLVFGGLLLIFYVQSHQEVVSGSQRYIAEDAARTVSGFIRERTSLLYSILRMDDPFEMHENGRRRYLESLLSIQPSVRSLFLFDSRNEAAGSASRVSMLTSGKVAERLHKNPPLKGPQEPVYISPVYIDPDTSEPMVILAVPVTNLLNDYEGFLAAELNLKFMWELVEILDERANGKAYVVDRQGNLIAFSDTARVLRVENVSNLKVVGDFVDSSGMGESGVELYTGITGRLVVGTYSALGTPDWAVVVEVAAGEAYKAVARAVVLSVIVFLAFSVLAGLLGVFIARRLSSPLVHLTRTATEIANGTEGLQADVSGPREVAGLAAAFNSMTAQLLKSHASLEAQLVEIEKGQEALRDSEERYRNIIDNANEIIYTLSPEGVFTFVSPAWTRLLGHPVSEVAGKHFSHFVHPDDAAACEEFLRKVLSTGQPHPGVNYRVMHTDGEWRWHTSVGSSVSDGFGRPNYYVGIAQDITWKIRAEEDKAKLEQQLFQAQKMESIGRLAGGVAHDFNNMLNVILGFSELIKLETIDDEPLIRKIDEIERAAGQARDITRQLLAFSRKQIISPVTLDINERMRENQKTLARLIGEDIDIQFYPCDGLWKVKLDPSQLNQIVYNFAINARDAMPNGGKLTIETANAVLDDAYCSEHVGYSPGNYVTLTISDNGIGMDKETQSHLFEPFFTTKEVGKGTGLGLATVYGIVKQNGGFINVYSELGQGTTFRIYFARDTGEITAGSKADESPVRSCGGTIVLVEDNEMMRSLTTIELERLGYKVLSLRTPGEALAAYEKRGSEFILLLTDVIMPVMNGVELKNRILSIRPDTKVLFMSGYTANSIVHQGALDKDIHFIQKPFTLAELAKKVREAIEGK